MENPQETLIMAIDKAGGPTVLAKVLGITPEAICQWRTTQSKVCPAHQVLRMETITGIRRERLRPDLYPPEDAPAPTGQATETT